MQRDNQLSAYVLGKQMDSWFDSDVTGMQILMCEFDMRTLAFTRITNNCLEFFGYTQEEMEGKNLNDFCHPDDVIPAVEVVNKNYTNPSPILNHRNRYIHKNGNIIHCLWNASPTAAGRTISLCVIERIETQS